MLKKTLPLLILGILFFGSVPFIASAAVGIDPGLHPKGAPTVSGQEPAKDAKPSDAAAEYTADATRALLLERVTNVILGIAGTVAIFFIINNAWYLVISSGSEEKIGQHKKGIMWAVIGLILIILSYSIVRFVISIPFQADEAVLNTTAEGGGGGAPAP